MDVLREPPRLQPAGPTSFEVACWKGMSFGVEASTDLERWTAVGTVMNTDGTARFDDAVPVHGACRFDRVVER